MRLIDEKYRVNSNESIRDFATRKVALFKACDPNMTSEEIFSIIIRQFPVGIQNLLNSVIPLDFDRLQELLSRYDQTFFVTSKNDRRGEVNYITRDTQYRRAAGRQSGSRDGDAASGRELRSGGSSNGAWSARRVASDTVTSNLERAGNRSDLIAAGQGRTETRDVQIENLN